MFFQKKMNDDDRGIRDVNMTPLIDVSLVLVVMLLLATPLAFESSIAVRKANKSAKVSQEKSKTERVEIRVFSEDSVRVNTQIVARTDLTDALKPYVEASSERLVVVSCAGDVSHGAFVNVLDQTKVAGASEIAVTGR